MRPTVHRKVARRRRQLDSHAVQILCDLDLTSEARSAATGRVPVSATSSIANARLSARRAARTCPRVQKPCRACPERPSGVSGRRVARCSVGHSSRSSRRTFSSSDGSSSLSYESPSSMQWHVEHAIDFSHAARMDGGSQRGQLSSASCSAWPGLASPFAHRCRPTFDVQVVLP